ncbi:MAG: toll/interleukin-1 receptor domain-containing protein [Pseudomonadota bacterium]
MVQIDDGMHRECSGWFSLGGSEVVQLVVTASPQPAAQQDAKALFDEIQLRLSHSGLQPQVAACGGGFGPGAEGCWATSHPGAVRRVVVWVADAAGSAPSVNLQPQGATWTTVLPLLPHGASVTVLPGHLAQTVAAWRRPGQITALVPDVLTAAGVPLNGFRIFISYRWDDSQGFAEQLFDGLSHQQFEVYLDRFRTSPGANFVERIRAELADKACVILLDSRHIARSSWVAGEYAFARLYKLGVMAIDLPGGQRTFPRIGTRLDLRAAAPASIFARATVLASAHIDAAVDFVRANYAAEISRRHRHQRRQILSAARLAGVTATARPDGLVGTAGYLFAPSARPPDVEIFRRACEAAAGEPAPAPRPVIVGPLSAQLHSARQDVRWLARSTASVAVDERRILRAMRRAAGGRL